MRPRAATLINFFKLPQNIFVVLALIFGALFIIFTPPLFGIDESTHFLRAYSISEGHITDKQRGKNTGEYLPTDLAQLRQAVQSDLYANLASPKKPDWALFKPYHSPINTKQKQWTYFEGAAVYSPIPYVPQVVAIKIGVALKLSIVNLVYFGRILNLLVWVTLIYLAIRYARIGRWGFFAIALIPMSLYQAASLSPDALTIASALLLFAVITHVVVQPRAISWRQAIVLALLCITLALCKETYFLFALLLWFVPSEKFGSLKKYLVFNIATTTAVLLCTGVWYELVKGTANNLASLQRPDMLINSHQQIVRLVHNPFRFLKVLANAFITRGDSLYIQFAGDFSWTFIALPLAVVFSVYSALLLALFDDYDGKVLSRIPPRFRYGVAAIAILGVLAIAITFYITYTPVGAGNIDGIQGRYFLPFAPLLIVLAANRHIYIHVKSSLRRSLVVSLVTINLAAAAVFIAERNIFGIIR